MTKFIAVLIFIMPLSAIAEPMDYSYTEPSAQAGALLQTCIRFSWCTNSTTCKREVEQAKICTNSDDGNGGDTIAGVINIPIYQGDLPVTVNFCTNSESTDGNETARWTTCGTPKCFGPTCP